MLSESFAESAAKMNIVCPLKPVKLVAPSRSNTEAIKSLKAAMSLVPTFYLFKGSLQFISVITAKFGAKTEHIVTLNERWQVKG